MQSRRIEDNPERYHAFTQAVQTGRVAAVMNVIGDDLSVDESTLAGLGNELFRNELRFKLEGRQALIGRLLLAPTPPHAPHPLASSERAAYRVRHFDMMEQFTEALQTLVRFNVYASRSDVSVEFHLWLVERATALRTAQQVRTHYTAWGRLADG